MNIDSDIYNEIAPGAPIVRHPRDPRDDPSPEDSRAKDRRPVIRYGRPRHSTSRSRHSKGEVWLINTDGKRADDRYLLGTIADDDATTFPLESRPSLIRLYMACALADADILVESGVSEPVLAVLAEFTGLKPTTPVGASKRTPRRLMVTDYPKTHPREGATAYRKAIDSINPRPSYETLVTLSVTAVIRPAPSRPKSNPAPPGK